MALETPATVRKELENAVAQINQIMATYTAQIADLTERVSALEAPKTRGKSSGA